MILKCQKEPQVDMSWGNSLEKRESGLEKQDMSLEINLKNHIKTGI